MFLQAERTAHEKFARKAGKTERSATSDVGGKSE
jgi:hypothetical protein